MSRSRRTPAAETIHGAGKTYEAMMPRKGYEAGCRQVHLGFRRHRSNYMEEYHAGTERQATAEEIAEWEAVHDRMVKVADFWSNVWAPGRAFAASWYAKVYYNRRFIV